MFKCQREGCENEGKYEPVILLYADTEHAPIEWKYLGLYACEECRSKLKIEDFIPSDTEWKRIVLHVVMQGKKEPDRGLTELEWRSL